MAAGRSVAFRSSGRGRRRHWPFCLIGAGFYSDLGDEERQAETVFIAADLAGEQDGRVASGHLARREIHRLCEQRRQPQLVVRQVATDSTITLVGFEPESVVHLLRRAVITSISRR